MEKSGAKIQLVSRFEDGHPTLSIRDVADLTGLTPAALRMR